MADAQHVLSEIALIAAVLIPTAAMPWQRASFHVLDQGVSSLVHRAEILSQREDATRLRREMAIRIAWSERNSDIVLLQLPVIFTLSKRLGLHEPWSCRGDFCSQVNCPDHQSHDVKNLLESVDNYDTR